MRRNDIIPFGIVATLALALSPAFAQDPVTIGKKSEVDLTTETRVGPATLQPGHYVFQH